MLYLVQHGQAKPEDEDPQRPLTDRGADDVAWVAHWAVDRFGVRPSQSSTPARHGPARRPRSGSGWSASTPSRATVSPPTMTRRRGLVGSPTRPADVMLVGHLPHLAKLASVLLTGDPDRQLIGFHQGGLVAVEHTDTGWIVALLLPPAAA